MGSGCALSSPAANVMVIRPYTNRMLFGLYLPQVYNLGEFRVKKRRFIPEPGGRQRLRIWPAFRVGAHSVPVGSGQELRPYKYNP
jgi:hypothetical protein